MHEKAVHTYYFFGDGSHGNAPGGVTRYARLDCLCAPMAGSKGGLEERDVCVAVLYVLG
jgi:hypothetical protein